MPRKSAKKSTGRLQKFTYDALIGRFQYIESVLFLCLKYSMDMRKLCEKLFNNDKIKDIPLEHVIRVVSVVFEIINSGECFFENEWGNYGFCNDKSESEKKSDW